MSSLTFAVAVAVRARVGTSLKEASCRWLLIYKEIGHKRPGRGFPAFFEAAHVWHIIHRQSSALL